MTLKIVEAKGLKPGSHWAGATPAAYVICEFIDLEHDGYKHIEVETRHTCKTRKKKVGNEPAL